MFNVWHETSLCSMLTTTCSPAAAATAPLLKQLSLPPCAPSLRSLNVKTLRVALASFFAPCCSCSISIIHCNGDCVLQVTALCRVLKSSSSLQQGGQGAALSAAVADVLCAWAAWVQSKASCFSCTRRAVPTQSAACAGTGLCWSFTHG